MNSKKSVQLIGLFIGFMMVSISCGKNETEVLDTSSFGYDYYPVEIGKKWIYQVDSVVYSLKLNVEIDSSTSYLSEEVVDSFRNAENKLVYRLDVYTTRDTNQSWELINASFIQKDETQFHKIENGLDFLKLVFPVLKNKSWDGNSRINANTGILINGELLEPFEFWNYSYDYIDKQESIGNILYSKVCKVTEVDDENLLSKHYSAMKYAKGVGMVYKEQWFLDTQNTDDSIPFKDRAQKGMILRQSLVSHN